MFTMLLELPNPKSSPSDLHTGNVDDQKNYLFPYGDEINPHKEIEASGVLNYLTAN